MRTDMCTDAQIYVICIRITDICVNESAQAGLLPTRKVKSAADGSPSAADFVSVRKRARGGKYRSASGAAGTRAAEASGMRRVRKRRITGAKGARSERGGRGERGGAARPPSGGRKTGFTVSRISSQPSVCTVHAQQGVNRNARLPRASRAARRRPVLLLAPCTPPESAPFEPARGVGIFEPIPLNPHHLEPHHPGPHPSADFFCPCT